MEIVLSVILLFVGVVVVIAIHICVVGRAFRRAFEDGRMVQRNIKGSKKMSKEDLKMLPGFDYEAADKENCPVDCVVCLESYKTGDKCKSLPNCKHIFHAECIESWLLKTAICPICRTSANPLLDDESGVSSLEGVEAA